MVHERIFSSLQEVIKLISFCEHPDYVNVKCLTFRVGFVSLLYSNNTVFLTKRKAEFVFSSKKKQILLSMIIHLSALSKPIVAVGILFLCGILRFNSRKKQLLHTFNLRRNRYLMTMSLKKYE